MTELELLAIEKLLAGADSRLAVLRSQLPHVTVTRREYTGVGFFTDLSVAPNAERLTCGRAHIGDVHADVEGLDHAAGVILWIDDGALSCLEGYANAGDWPVNARLIRLFYIHHLSTDPPQVAETADRDLEWALEGLPPMP